MVVLLIACGSSGEPAPAAIVEVAVPAEPRILGDVPRPPAGCGAMYHLFDVDPPCANALNVQRPPAVQCIYLRNDRSLIIEAPEPIGLADRLDCVFDCGTFAVRVVDSVDPRGPVAALWQPGASNCDETVVYQGRTFEILTPREPRARVNLWDDPLWTAPWLVPPIKP